MSEPTDPTGRCPSCGARVVPDQEWCSLCHQPLATRPSDRDDAADDEVPADPADPYAGAAAAGTQAAPGQLPPGAAEAMLAELAASSAAERPRGPLSGTSRGVRIAVGCGAAIVLLGVLLALLALLGLLL